ncbi:hypothetical protein T4B_11469 [Trichinella pseudospiralis]|uniref:Secreted protein n=2 Tax=Trichinella pseudospiralis TaxID=6337 RepID=A0A0V1HMT3_TRIPS|nr:hypothetical protein T4A_5853 [Trichinella pseudospiralis]KRY82681.1 hypothetical protein T4D_175 [Trichinella pseudospiralis]KRZ11767.1 hypothetical protein T4B_11469 [Trichinella pseudospiralis]KRZ29281.1 hypothetical protein T4C_4393 [Trichinella pseudospiralis]
MEKNLLMLSMLSIMMDKIAVLCFNATNVSCTSYNEAVQFDGEIGPKQKEALRTGGLQQPRWRDSWIDGKLGNYGSHIWKHRMCTFRLAQSHTA